MRTKNFITVLIFIALSHNLKAIRDYQSGIIITNNSDTVRGFIIEKNEFFYTSKVLFFEDEKNVIIKQYSPADIKGFRLNNGRYFIAATIPLVNSKDSSLVFLEWLLKGIVNLYAYYEPDNQNIYYYLQPKENEFVLLSNSDHTIYDTLENKYYYKKRKEYIGILRYYFKDAPPVIEKLNNLNLNRSSLINVTKNYHNYVCKNEACEIFESQNNLASYAIGINFSSLNTSLNDFNTSYVNYPVGFTFTVTKIPYLRNFEFQIEYTYIKQSFKYFKEVQNHRIPVLLRYNVNLFKKKAGIIGAIGFTFNHRTSTNEYMKKNSGSNTARLGLFYNLNKRIQLEIDYGIEHSKAVYGYSYYMFDSYYTVIGDEIFQSAYMIGLRYNLK